MQESWRRSVGWAGLAAVLVVLAGCGDRAGTPCEISGSGFTASHDCSTKCLSRWSVFCPDESKVLPKMCAGREGCTPGSCPDGQLCYTFDDPFDEVSYCVPDNVCGEAPDALALRRWEDQSVERATAQRARYRRNRPDSRPPVTKTP